MDFLAVEVDFILGRDRPSTEATATRRKKHAPAIAIIVGTLRLLLSIRLSEAFLIVTEEKTVFSSSSHAQRAQTQPAINK